MTFWDFANNNPIVVLLIVYFVADSVVKMMRAICKKKEPYECDDKEGEKL